MDESLPPQELVAAATADDGDSAPHHMRITSSGRVRNFVKFGTGFLQVSKTVELSSTYPAPRALNRLSKSHSNRPLIIHSLPSSSAARQESADSPQVSPETPNHPSTKKRPQVLHPSTVTIPRLISIVEIIKREFVTFAARQDRKVVPFGQERDPPLRLHQYNFVGVLEDDDESARNAPLNLTYALSGKNHIRIKRTPYMKIYLCRTELPPEVVRGATYQGPLLPPKKSRAAKSRERKRRKKISIALNKQAEIAPVEAIDAAMEQDDKVNDEAAA